jgi:hypothetical protein
MGLSGLKYQALRLGVTAQEQGRAIADIGARIDDESRLGGQGAGEDFLPDEVPQDDLPVLFVDPKRERMSQRTELMRHFSTTQGQPQDETWPLSQRQRIGVQPGKSTVPRHRQDASDGLLHGLVSPAKDIALRPLDRHTEPARTSCTGIKEISHGVVSFGDNFRELVCDRIWVVRFQPPTMIGGGQLFGGQRELSQALLYLTPDELISSGDPTDVTDRTSMKPIGAQRVGGDSLISAVHQEGGDAELGRFQQGSRMAVDQIGLSKEFGV